jgi:hypothetical protein
MPINAMVFGSGLCALSAAAALAQPSRPTPERAAAIRASCKADFQTFCAAVPRGMAALSCLQQNVAKLSPPCQKAVGAAGAPQ